MSALYSGNIELYDYCTHDRLAVFLFHLRPVRCANFHPTLPLFVSGSDDRIVAVWSLGTVEEGETSQSNSCNSPLFTLTGHLDYLRMVQFHSDSTLPWILSCSDDQTLRIWNWETQVCLAVLTGHTHYVMCAVFHPKENLIASASLDNCVRLWDFNSLREKSGGKKEITPFRRKVAVKFVMKGHIRGVNWVCFHPNLPFLASSSDDFTVKLWQFNNKKAWLVQTLVGHESNVSSVVFGANFVLLSVGEDKQFCFWKVEEILNYALESPFEGEKKDFLVKKWSINSLGRFWVVTSFSSPDMPMSCVAAGHDFGFSVFPINFHNMSSFDWFSCPLSSAGNILARLKANDPALTNISKLRLPTSQTHCAMQALAEALMSNTVLNSIRLGFPSNQPIPPSKFILLCDVLAHHPSLTDINLYDNPNTFDITLLCTALTGNKDGSILQSLELGSNKLSSAAARSLAGVLRSANCSSLTLLGLECNLLGDSGVCHLVDVFTKGENSSLCQLFLTQNEVGPTGVVALAEALQTKSCSLKTLVLGENKLGNDGVEALSKALTTNLTVEALGLHCTAFSLPGLLALTDCLSNSNQTLTDIDLGGNGIDDDGCIHLARILNSNKGLKSLVLEGNLISDKGGKMLCNALKVNPFLRSLALQRNRLSNQALTYLSHVLSLSSAKFSPTSSSSNSCLLRPCGVLISIFEARFGTQFDINSNSLDLSPALQQIIRWNRDHFTSTSDQLDVSIADVHWPLGPYVCDISQGAKADLLRSFVKAGLDIHSTRTCSFGNNSDPSSAIVEGDSALCCAVRGGDIHCVELLLNCGADLTHRNSNSETAFDIAAKLSTLDSLGRQSPRNRKSIFRALQKEKQARDAKHSQQPSWLRNILISLNPSKSVSSSLPEVIDLQNASFGQWRIVMSNYSARHSLATPL